MSFKVSSVLKAACEAGRQVLNSASKAAIRREAVRGWEALPVESLEDGPESPHA